MRINYFATKRSSTNLMKLSFVFHNVALALKIPRDIPEAYVDVLPFRN